MLPVPLQAQTTLIRRRFDQSVIELLGSGAILREVIAASQLLSDVWRVSADVWSVTSFTELSREARDVERWNRLHPTEARRRGYVVECLPGDAPIVAATDCVCLSQLDRELRRRSFSVAGDGRVWTQRQS